LETITKQVNLISMEKRTPHCKLAVVRTVVAAGKVRDASGGTTSEANDTSSMAPLIGFTDIA
jgi:hypothetical protein